MTLTTLDLFLVPENNNIPQEPSEWPDNVQIVNSDKKSKYR